MWFVKNPQEKAETQFIQAVGYAEHAALLAADGDYSSAVQNYDIALNLLRTAEANALDTSKFQRQMCVTLLALGELHGQYGNENESQHNYVAAIDTARHLVRTDDSLENLKLFQQCMLDGVSGLLDYERFEDGLKQARNVVDLSKMLLQRDLDAEDLQHAYAYSMSLLMHFEEGCGDLQEAYNVASNRCDFEMDLLEANPDHPSAIWRLADSIMAMSNYLEGDRKAAQYEIALGIMHDLNRKGQLPPHQVTTYEHLMNLRAGRNAIVANCHANHGWVAQN